MIPLFGEQRRGTYSRGGSLRGLLRHRPCGALHVQRKLGRRGERRVAASQLRRAGHRQFNVQWQQFRRLWRRLARGRAVARHDDPQLRHGQDSAERRRHIQQRFQPYNAGESNFDSIVAGNSSAAEDIENSGVVNSGWAQSVCDRRQHRRRRGTDLGWVLTLKRVARQQRRSTQTRALLAGSRR